MKKKWPILIVILIVLAIVLTIVFINLFRPKNTQALAKNVAEVTENGYLSQDNETNNSIETYLNLLIREDIEREEVSAFARGYDAFEIAGQFFDRQMLFTQYSDEYKSNVKNVQNNFKKAQSSASKLATYLKENGDKIDDSFVGRPQWLVLSWQDCKKDVKDMLAFSAKAFEGLTKIYKASVPSKIVNNDFSDVVLDHFNKVSTSVGSQEDSDTDLLTFANAYLSLDGEKIILAYQFEIDLKNKAKDLKEKQETSIFFADFVAGTILA